MNVTIKVSGNCEIDRNIFIDFINSSKSGDVAPSEYVVDVIDKNEN